MTLSGSGASVKPTITTWAPWGRQCMRFVTKNSTPASLLDADRSLFCRFDEVGSSFFTYPFPRTQRWLHPSPTHGKAHALAEVRAPPVPPLRLQTPATHGFK